MSKQHLSIFAIVAVSLIMGIPALMAEAERPGETVTIFDEPVNGNSTPGQIVCGFNEPAYEADVLIVETTYQNGKHSTVEEVETWTGEFFSIENGELVGSFDQKWTTTTKDNSGNDKGNGADRISKVKLKVLCQDGSVENDVTVTISHAKK